MSGFIVYILVSIFTPGPNNIFASAHSAKAGFWRTFPFMLGVLLGTFLVFVVTSWLNLFLYENVGFVNRVIGFLGGGFILYLAYLMFHARNDEETLMIQNGRLFPMAVLLTLINPKAILFGLTVATYYLELGFPSRGLYPLAVLNAVLCLVSVMVWGAFGISMRRILDPYRVQFHVVMAILLAYSGVLILIETI
jgi:threonine/homoserine/homoserine lactone efflux protein